jgi:glycosyltransferase involved in cell wall biosynthesis
MNCTIDTRFQRIDSSLLRLLLFLPRGLRAQGIDIFHGLDHIGVPPLAKVGRYIATIHDMIPLLWPQWVTYKHRLVVTAAYRRLGHQADRIITPSETTKADVVNRLQIDPQRIAVIPWGCDERFQPEGDPEHFAAVRHRYGLPAQYLLFVGTLEPRKNLTRLLQAYARLRAEGCGKHVQLVVAGRTGWLYTDIFDAVKTLGLNEEVVFTGFVDDADLPALYRGACLFVFPSLYEGFGLPILEAMASGVPVVTSTTASMPEVAGDAAVLVDPQDPEAIAAGMARVLAEDRLRQAMIQKGLARARRFTWDSVAEATLALYASLE